MTRVHVHGAAGRMGRIAVAAVEAAADLELAGATGRGDDLREVLDAGGVDVLVEFTVPTAVCVHVGIAIDRGVHVVSGTTGYDRSMALGLGQAAERAGVGVLLAPNFAIGVLLMQRFAVQAARWFPDVEIVELHRQGKLDAPSGTAIDTARRIARGAPTSCAPETLEGRAARGVDVDGIPVHAVRLPGLVAHQEVLFGGEGQLLTLRHDTLDRAAFAPGILLGVRRIGERTGLVDTLDAFLDP